MHGMYFASLHSYRIHFNTKTMILLSIPSMPLEWLASTLGRSGGNFLLEYNFYDAHDATNIKSVASQSTWSYTVFL